MTIMDHGKIETGDHEMSTDHGSQNTFLVGLKLYLCISVCICARKVTILPVFFKFENIPLFNSLDKFVDQKSQIIFTLFLRGLFHKIFGFKYGFK